MLEERDFPEIPGALMPDNVAYELKQEVSRLLGRRKLEFAGSQPVSFEERHITENLDRRDYFVCEKSDGLRVLMLCILDPAGEEAVFLITRENQFYRVPNFHFPLPDNETLCQNGTIIDGELVLSKRPGDGVKELRYLMFDCLTINGENIIVKPLHKRLGYLKERFYDPYFKLRSVHPKECEHFPFKLTLKGMHQAYKIPKLFDSLKYLGHVSDGLIFTCCETPYVFGTDQTLLKWKPSEENTVDFRLHLEIPIYTDLDLDERDPDRSYLNYDVKPELELFVWEGNTQYSKFSDLVVEDSEWEKLKSLNEPLEERVIECNKDEQGNWRLMRFRDDKSNGNHITIVRKVLQSIKDAVSKEDLIERAPEIEKHWKQRELERRHKHHQVQQQQQQHQQQQHQQQQHQQQHQLQSSHPTVPNEDLTPKRRLEDDIELPRYDDDDDENEESDEAADISVKKQRLE